MPTGKQYQLASFLFDDIPLAEDETVLASLRMFLDLELIDTFRIKHKVRIGPPTTANQRSAGDLRKAF